MNGIEYKGYFDFSGGYNDTASEDVLKDNELSVMINAVITDKNSIRIRNGTVNINDTPKNYEITKRFEYLIRDNSRILEVYNEKLYRTDLTGSDELLYDIHSDKPYFLQQQDVLYCCDGVNIYEIGGKDYFSNVGTVDIKADDIVQIADDFSGTGIIGYFYKALANHGSIDLESENYNDTNKWVDCTDILGATSSVVRVLKSYEAGKAEVTQISAFNDVVSGGYITVNLHGSDYDINVATSDTARDVATKIAATTFPGYTVTSKQNVVTFKANTIGFREDCYCESYDTGVSLVVNIETNGEDDDNILDEVRNCTKFIQHSKSGRYVAAGNPKKPHAVYFSEPYQLNYFKQFNILNPTSSEGSPVCLLNLLDSVLISYKHSWYEYAGLEPATDGSWKRLAIPYGCASEYSVQVLDLYSFVFLSHDGIYQVSSNILSQYGVATQNSSTVKCISEDKIENTIKTIADKSKCVSVYHDGIYYLAFNSIQDNPNNSIILYYINKKAYTLFSNVNVNDFLYKKDGTLEFASINYAMKFDNTKYVDINVNDGSEIPIQFMVKTSNLNLGSAISQKFIDKIFIQANIGAENFDKHLGLAISIDNIDIDSMYINLAKLNQGFNWGDIFGLPWGNYSTNMQSAFIRRKGNSISFVFTNILDPELNTNIIIYGIGISYKTLTPYQPISNLDFANTPPLPF